MFFQCRCNFECFFGVLKRNHHPPRSVVDPKVRLGVRSIPTGLALADMEGNPTAKPFRSSNLSVDVMRYENDDSNDRARVTDPANSDEAVELSVM